VGLGISRALLERLSQFLDPAGHVHWSTTSLFYAYYPNEKEKPNANSNTATHSNHDRRQETNEDSRANNNANTSDFAAGVGRRRFGAEYRAQG
jgi:tRNA G46 methylase TrmB